MRLIKKPIGISQLKMRGFLLQIIRLKLLVDAQTKMTNTDANKDYAPFRLADYDPTASNKMFDLKEDGNKIVRESTYYKGRQDLLEVTKNLQSVVEELEKDYGILTPGMSFVIGESTPDHSTPGPKTPLESIFIVVNKVNGQVFEKTEFADSELDQVKDELDILLSSLGRYTQDKYKSGGWTINDILPLHQYMYGTVSADPIKRFYLVDIDPQFIEERDPLTYQYDELFHLAKDIHIGEFKLKGRELTQARSQLSSILNSIPESDKGYPLIKKMKDRIAMNNFEVGDIFSDIFVS